MRLFQGQYDQETVFSEDPVAVAQQWQEEGARRLHVVDLDGALIGSPQNLEIVHRMVEALEIPIAFGGGLRDLQAIQKALEAGIDSVILGSAAIETPSLVRQACALYGGRVAVALDARNGIVMIHGWTEASGEPALDVAAHMVDVGVATLIYTDISRDGTMTEPNFDAVSQFVSLAGVPVIASGGISRAEHLVRLRNLGAEGAVVGRALYTGAIKLPDLRQLGLL